MKKRHGKINNLKAKVKDSYNCVYYSFSAIEMIDEYDFFVEIIDSLNYSYFNWKPKLVLVLIHNFPTSLTISDDNLETNG